MKITIRPVVIEDASAIVELLNPIISDGRYTSMKEQITVAEQIEFISLRLKATGNGQKSKGSA